MANVMTAVPHPSTRPPKIYKCLPLIHLLRRKFKKYLNKNSVLSASITRGFIKVNGKVRTKKRYPIGFMDLITIVKICQFRVMYNIRGNLVLHKISDEEAEYKFCKVKHLQVGPKGTPLLVTDDGRTIRNPDPLIEVHDTIQLNIATRKIMDFIKLDIGNVVMVTGGHNLGRVATIIFKECYHGSFDTVHLEDNKGQGFVTRVKNVFVIGKSNKPFISLPTVKRLKLSVAEERDQSLISEIASLKL